MMYYNIYRYNSYYLRYLFFFFQTETQDCFYRFFSYCYICPYVLYSYHIPTPIKNLMANFEKIDQDLVLDF